MNKKWGAIIFIFILLGLVTIQIQTERQFLGVWPDGVWIWNQFADKWTNIPSTPNAMMIAVGKVDDDDEEDLIGVWPSGLWVRNSSLGQWVRLSKTQPNWITAGDMNNDGRDDVIGSWPGDGVYSRDSATGKWNKISTPARQLAVGNIGGNGRDDLVGVWDTGIWVRYNINADWQKIDGRIPDWITVGDMTGSGQSNIIVSNRDGTWYRDSDSATWVKITTPAGQLAAGDIDGDGRDDLIGIWPTGLFVRYGARNQWQHITSSSKPKWITIGRTANALQAAGEDPLDYPLESANKMDIIDISRDGPGQRM